MSIRQRGTARAGPQRRWDVATLPLESAHADIEAGHTYSTFLWPLGSDRLAHVRVTVISATAITPTGHVGLVLLSPADDLRGLTRRELEVAGYLVDGCSNREIAHHLVLAPRTVATHVEHILAKFHVQTRTSAAVRACQEGLYVPVLAPDAPSGHHNPPGEPSLIEPRTQRL